MTRDKEKRNVAASVLARLLKRARETGDDYQTVLTAYACERFLARLASSNVRDRFILKGAMLLRTWSDHPYRMTRDLDLLRRGEGSEAAIRDDVAAVCATRVDDDGLVFDTASMRVEPIRAEDEYAGTRVSMMAHCARTRIAVQIDIGVGDAVFPKPEVREVETLLGMEKPRILAYRRETVVAEKLEAMIVLGVRSSRIKDFFDLRFLAETFPFERSILAEAVRRTLSRRNTPLPVGEPVGLTEAYWQNPARPLQVRAFARRAGLHATVEAGAEILSVMRPFLLPIIEDVRSNRTVAGTWPPGGPWQ